MFDAASVLKARRTAGLTSVLHFDRTIVGTPCQLAFRLTNIIARMPPCRQHTPPTAPQSACQPHPRSGSLAVPKTSGYTHLEAGSTSVSVAWLHKTVKGLGRPGIVEKRDPYMGIPVTIEGYQRLNAIMAATDTKPD